MKRWWLVLALLTSVGVNAGVLATVALSRLRPPAPASPVPVPPPAAPIPTPAPVAPAPPAPISPALPAPVRPERPAPVRPAPRPTPSPTPIAPAAAAPAPPEPEPAPESPASRQKMQNQIDQRIGELADRVELKDDDRERFVALQHRLVTATGPDRRRLQQVHRELRRQSVSPQPDAERIEKLTAESAELYLRIERAVVANVLETRRLLSPEQESKFLHLVESAEPGKSPFAPPGPPGPLWRRALERRERLHQGFGKRWQFRPPGDRPEPPPPQP